MMQQYRDAKAKHPDMLLLFRMGDFYELFESDAETAHKVLGLTLTSRDKEMPMAGFPHHQLEPYLHKLLHAGHRVAVCDQVEDSSQAKGLVKREVTRVVTPGTITEDDLLDPKQAEPVGRDIAYDRRRPDGSGLARRFDGPILRDGCRPRSPGRGAGPLGPGGVHLSESRTPTHAATSSDGSPRSRPWRRGPTGTSIRKPQKQRSASTSPSPRSRVSASTIEQICLAAAGAFWSTSRKC